MSKKQQHKMCFKGKNTILHWKCYTDFLYMFIFQWTKLWPLKHDCMLFIHSTCSKSMQVHGGASVTFKESTLTINRPNKPYIPQATKSESLHE